MGRCNHSSFEVLERKRKAATILDSPELLMTYADALQDVSSPSFLYPSPPLSYVTSSITTSTPSITPLNIQHTKLSIPSLYVPAIALPSQIPHSSHPHHTNKETNASQNYQSIAGTRQIFTKILCGYEDHTTKNIWGGIKTGKVPKPTWPERPSRRPPPNLRSTSH